MLTGICTLFAACSEQEENESLINSAIQGEEAVDVNISLSLSPEVYLNVNTDYQPMSTRAGETDPNKILSLIDYTYKCLVLKEIDNQWYVERLEDMEWTDPTEDYVGITANTKFNDLQLTLRPGHYKILAVLNPQAGVWNPGLVPGAIVKNESDTITHAYTYFFQRSSDYSNQDMRQVGAEIFAGTAEFEVVKTSDLHTGPINGNTTISFTRKVMNMRYLLKDNGTEGPPNFVKTQYTVFATLKATQSNEVFCDGLDCWGEAYYNRQNPTTELEICMCITGVWRRSITNELYQMTSHNATIYSPFVYTDDKRPVSYQMEKLKVYGQAGEFFYVYPNIIEDLKLTNNTIQQIVLLATDEIEEVPSYRGKVTLEHLKDEDSMDLFDKYYENTLTEINPY